MNQNYFNIKKGLNGYFMHKGETRSTVCLFGQMVYQILQFFLTLLFEFHLLCEQRGDEDRQLVVTSQS